MPVTTPGPHETYRNRWVDILAWRWSSDETKECRHLSTRDCRSLWIPLPSPGAGRSTISSPVPVLQLGLFQGIRHKQSQSSFEPCTVPEFGSVTYSVFGAGGVWMEDEYAHYYVVCAFGPTSCT